MMPINGTPDDAASNIDVRPNATHISDSLSELERESRARMELDCHPDFHWFDTHFELLLGWPCHEQPHLYIEVLLLFVQWYFKEGRLEKARPLAARAVEAGRKSNLLALLRRSLNLLGAVNSRLGNFSVASACYVHALEIADQIGDRIGKAAVLANLSELQFNAGLLAESVALNRYVIDLTGNEPHLVQLAACAHHNIAVASLLLDDVPLADIEIRKAIELAICPKNQFWAHQRVIFEVTYSKILVKQGNVDEARLRAGIAADFARMVRSRPAEVQASLAQILCEAAGGTPDVALARLEYLRDLIDPNEPAYRDLLETELACNAYAGHFDLVEFIQEQYLRNLAQFQRLSAIQQIAAFQRGVRTWGAVPVSELLPLSQKIRRRLANSWTSSSKHYMFREQLEALTILADQREHANARHSTRVGTLVHLLSAQIGYTTEAAATLGLAARLHDIGKVAVPDFLLFKRGKLLPKEADIVRRHTTEGCQMLTDIIGSIERNKTSAFSGQLDSLRIAADVVLHHHEWWDGSGYPRQLRASAIPESARMTALADVFDELTMPRPYKLQSSIDEALHTIGRLSGRQFDPRLCEAFLTLIGKMREQYGQDLEQLMPTDGEQSPYESANSVIERIVEAVKLMPSTDAIFGSDTTGTRGKPAQSMV